MTRVDLTKAQCAELAKNTMRRIIRGVDKFTIRSGKPLLRQLERMNYASRCWLP